MLKPPTLIYAFLDSGLQTYFKPHLEYYTSSCNTRRFAARNRWWTSIVEQPSTQHQTQALRDRQKAHLFRRLSTITMLLCLVLHSCCQPTSGSRGRGGSGGSNPPLKNNVKGFNPKYKIISSEWCSIYRKCTIFLPQINFFPAGMPPDPPSYGMSDVNPHLT